MACAQQLLDQFLNGEETVGKWTIKNFMLNEGRRVIFISARYDSTTGKLTYAASVFKRDEFNAESDDVDFPSDWTLEQFVDSLWENGAVVEIGEKLYWEITAMDVDNHMHTTDARFKLRPVKLEVETGLSYEEVLQLIRWEMCHGHGCKGPRSSKKKVDDDASSENSFLSTDSIPEMSDSLARAKTVHRARYITHDRDIFISFKGRSRTGEIAYGAAIHRRSNPDDMMDQDMVENHWKTAETRLERSPVVFHLNEDQMDFSHQLKRHASHREDVTVVMVDNIMTRRGGRIQVRSY